jgi:hypothetical protein
MCLAQLTHTLIDAFGCGSDASCPAELLLGMGCIMGMRLHQVVAHLLPYSFGDAINTACLCCDH